MAFLLAFVITFIIGTLVGHAVHMMLHRPWSGLFFRAHMDHHIVQYPPENIQSIGHYRTSGAKSGWIFFVPLIVLALLIGVGILFLFHVSLSIIALVVCEVAILGGLNGYIHDALHVSDHFIYKLPGAKKLWSLNAVHHRDMRRNFGIYFFGWDRIFKSFRVANKIAE